MIRHFIYRINYLRVYLSPFKFFWPKLYIGKVAIGTPYLYPRRWVKYSREDAREAAISEYKKYLGRKAVPKIIGFDFVSLGFKTKWDELDYRYEWSPIWSFVFFKWQIAVLFVPPYPDQYWTCWLVYHRHTDKKDSVRDRIKKAKELFPCVWTSVAKKETIYDKDSVTKKETICYWDKILKDKYLK